MRRLLITMIVILSLLLSVVVAAASWLGRSVETQRLTALVNHQTSYGIQPRVQFIDLARALRVSFLPPTPYKIVDIQLDGPFHASLLTQRTANPEGVRTSDLYYIDLHPHRAIGAPLFTIWGIAPHQQASVSLFGPSWSPDHTQLSYFDPVEGTINLVDTQTRQSQVIAEHVNSGYFRGGGTWSPDNSQFAFTPDNQVLTIVNVDGSNLRRFDLSDISSFFANWSSDSQRVLISHFIGRNAPIRVIDVQTMQADTDIAYHWGSAAHWCDDRWIAFVRHQPNGQVLPYMLDVQSDVEYNLGNNAALIDRTTQTMAFDEACEHVFLGTLPSTNAASRAMLYISDLTGNHLEHLPERIRTWSEHAGELTYIIAELDGSFSVYRAPIYDVGDSRLLVNFQPTKALASTSFSPTWIENTDMGLVYVPGTLYRIDRHGLQRLFQQKDDLLSYMLWPES